MPPKSKRQARFLGAVAGGKARVKGGPSPERAREMLRGSKHSDLPERADRRQRMIDAFTKMH